MSEVEKGEFFWCLFVSSATLISATRFENGKKPSSCLLWTELVKLIIKLVTNYIHTCITYYYRHKYQSSLTIR